MKKNKYTVGNPGGEWVVWEQTPRLRWVAKCPNEATADKIARVLNRCLGRAAQGRLGQKEVR